MINRLLDRLIGDQFFSPIMVNSEQLVSVRTPRRLDARILEERFYYMVIVQYDFFIVSCRHGNDNHYPSGKTLQFH